MTGKRYNRAATDTTAAFRHIPLFHTEDLHDVIPFDCVPVAIEFVVPSAVSLVTYVHPQRALYIFGPEDGNIGKHILAWCKDIVTIPATYCLNLAAAVNVVLYDRLAKQKERAL